MDKKHEIDAICATHRSEMARIASQHEHLRVSKDQYQSEHVAEMQKRAATIKMYEDKLHETYNRPMFELAEANKTRYIGLEFEPKLRDLRPLVLPPTPAREPSNSRPPVLPPRLPTPDKESGNSRPPVLPSTPPAPATQRSATPVEAAEGKSHRFFIFYFYLFRVRFTCPKRHAGAPYGGFQANPTLLE